MPRESGAAEYQDAVARLDRLRRREALLKIHRVVEKVSTRCKQIAVDGAAHPIFLDDDADVFRMALPAREKLLPRGVRVRRARPHRFDFDVKVVGAAIDDEVYLAPVWQ